MIKCGVMLDPYQDEMDDYLRITLPKNILAKEQLIVLNSIYTGNEYELIDINLPTDLNYEQICKYINICTSLIPNELAEAILMDIAEMDSLAPELVVRMYDEVSEPIRISLCLRKDIPEGIVKKCIMSDNEDVIMHVVFNDIVTIHQCNEILNKYRQGHVVDAIKRAIAYKKQRNI